MTHNGPKPSAITPSPDPAQMVPTQLPKDKASLSMWGSPPEVWAKWGWRLAFLCAVCVVAWQSLQPALSEGGILHMDKLIHFIAYAIICGLGLLSRFRVKPIWVLWGIILFGVMIEVLQGVMQLGRTASLADIIANTLGAGVVFLFWKKIKPSKKTS